MRWKAEVPGLGTSSPILSRGRVYLTSAYPVAGDEPRGDQWRAVFSFDAATGELVWEKRLYSAPAEKHDHRSTIAVPTPVADGGQLYVYFGSVLARLDRDGEVVWQHEIDPTYTEHSHYGAASSPVLAGDAVIVVQDKETGLETEDVGWMAAFDRETGERIWRNEWHDRCCSYSTPVVIDRGSGPEIVFAHSGMVASYDPEDGALLWKHPYGMWQVVSGPVIEGDLLGVPGGAHNRRGTSLIRLQGSGEDTLIEPLWEDPQSAPEVSSGVLIGGRLYTVTQAGVMVSREAETGEIVWRERLVQKNNRAALLAAEGKIYVGSAWGRVTVVEASDEFRILAENDLGERGSSASPAVGDGCILVRTASSLYCVGPEA